MHTERLSYTAAVEGSLPLKSMKASPLLQSWQCVTLAWYWHCFPDRSNQAQASVVDTRIHLLILH